MLELMKMLLTKGENMSQSLDELLERMEREKQPAMTLEQLRQLTHEENTRDAAMAQQARQVANQQSQINASQHGGLRNFLEQGRSNYNVPKTKHRKYFVNIADYDDHDVEADEIVINGNFILFMKNGNIELITTADRLVHIKESEE